MASPWIIAASTALAGAIGAGSRRFTAWRHWRNNLPDEEREYLWWNDTRYGRLSYSIWLFWRIVLVASSLLLILTAWVVGLALHLWTWPFDAIGNFRPFG